MAVSRKPTRPIHQDGVSAGLMTYLDKENGNPDHLRFKKKCMRKRKCRERIEDHNLNHGSVSV